MSTPKELTDYLVALGREYPDFEEYIKVLHNRAETNDKLALEAIELRKRRTPATTTRAMLNSAIRHEHDRTG